jgi:hypothetical protein
MSINGKNSEITVNDLALCGHSVGLEKGFIKKTIEEVGDVFSRLHEAFKDTHISTDMQKVMLKNIEPLSVRDFPERKR